MSVRPVTFNPDGSVVVVHDDAPDGAHGGIVPAASVEFVKSPSGTADHRGINLPCPYPGCGSVSTHPIGGGAAPALVQEMFVRLVKRTGCPCGIVTPGKPIAIVQAHVKLQTERMDGVGRWQAGSLK